MSGLLAGQKKVCYGLVFGLLIGFVASDMCSVSIGWSVPASGLLGAGGVWLAGR